MKTNASYSLLGCGKKGNVASERIKIWNFSREDSREIFEKKRTREKLFDGNKRSKNYI